MVTQLGLQTLSDEQIDELKAFATEINQDLETFRKEFEGQRRLIELLDVQINLKVENDEKIAYVQYHLGETNLSVAELESYGKVW